MALLLGRVSRYVPTLPSIEATSAITTAIAIKNPVRGPRCTAAASLPGGGGPQPGPMPMAWRGGGG
ncbi:hypothetical protein GCM10027203_56380 [Nonomuraea fastidiosa]